MFIRNYSAKFCPVSSLLSARADRFSEKALLRDVYKFLLP